MSVNSIGVGPPSNTVTATTAEEGEFDSTKFVVVLIAAVVLVCFFIHPSFFVSPLRPAQVCEGGGSVRDRAESLLAGKK